MLKYLHMVSQRFYWIDSAPKRFKNKKCLNICVCDRFILLVYTYRISQRFYWIDFAPKRFKSNKYPTCTKLLRNSSWFAKKSE